MPARSVHYIGLAVSDVERSLAFYLDLLGPLGWRVTRRYPTYRGDRGGHLPRDGGTERPVRRRGHRTAARRWGAHQYAAAACQREVALHL
jgi:catechol 2,3-dioxygenase-like lactoylglutathione lyase family enzyme